MKKSVDGVGYVGLSLAVLLALKHKVAAVTTTEAKAARRSSMILPNSNA